MTTSFVFHLTTRSGELLDRATNERVARRVASRTSHHRPVEIRRAETEELVARYFKTKDTA